MAKRNTHKYLSKAEFRKLLSYVKGQADLARKKGSSRAVVDELIILLLARAGLRSNELCALKIEDLPLRNGEETLWIRDETGDILRKVGISRDIAELLARFVRLYRNGAKQTDYLLESERGNPFGYMNLYSKVRRIAEKAGIGKLSLVTLRHTYMMRLYQAEQDLRYVQEQTGYNSRRTIAKYVTSNVSKKKTLEKSSADLTGQESTEQISRYSVSKQTCEACGAKISKGKGKRIDSGQLLCRDCLMFFRTA